VDLLVSRTRFACALRCVSLSSSLTGGTKDLSKEIALSLVLTIEGKHINQAHVVNAEKEGRIGKPESNGQKKHHRPLSSPTEAMVDQVAIDGSAGSAMVEILPSSSSFSLLLVSRPKEA